MVIDYSIDNIRLLKRVVYDLNEFSYLGNGGYDKALLDGLMSYIFFVSTEINKTEEYQKYQYGYAVHSAHSCIDQYFENSIIKKSCLTEALTVASKDLTKYSIQESMRELYMKYSFDFSYDPNQYAEEAFKILQGADDADIVQYLGFRNLKFYIDLLSELNSDEKPVYEDYLIGVTKAYIETIDFSQIERFFFREDISAMETYPELKEYIDEQKQNFYDKNALSVDDIDRLMSEPMEKNGWGDTHTKGLASISSNRYKELMLESVDFTESAYDFVKWNNGFAGQRPFEDACKNILDAFQSIGETDPRAKKLLEHLTKKD